MKRLSVIVGNRIWVYLGWSIIALILYAPVMKLDLGEDGLFAIQANRLLSGQLPNIDFSSAYMGGNIYYNAFWFLILKPSILSLRIGFLVLLMVYLPVLFYLARRIMSPLWASFAALMAFLLTIPYYPFTTANWFALVCSLLALISLLKSLEIKSLKNCAPWLILSGLLLSISIWMKHTVGLYTGYAFFIILLSHLSSPWSAEQLAGLTSPSRRLKIFGSILLKLGTVIIPLYLLYIASPHPVWFTYALVVFPPCFLLFEAWRFSRKNQWPGLESWFGFYWGWLLTGLVGGLSVYLGPYILSGNILPFLQRTFVTSSSYIKLFFGDPTTYIPSEIAGIALLFGAGILLLRKAALLGWFLLFLCSLLYFEVSQIGFQAWLTMTNLMVMVLTFSILAVGLYLFRKSISSLSQSQTEEAFQKSWTVSALFIYSVMMLINIYPPSNLVYFAYSIAPLIIYLVYLVSRAWQSSPGWARVPVVIFFGYWLVLGLAINYRVLNPAYPFLINPPVYFQSQWRSERAGIQVEATAHARVQMLLDFIQSYSKREDDTYILTSTGPLAYFLSKHTNPTSYDYPIQSIHSSGDDIVKDLEKHRVQYVVVSPQEPVQLQPILEQYLQTHFTTRLSIPPYWLILERL